MAQVPHVVPRDDGTFAVEIDHRPAGGSVEVLSEGLTEEQAHDFCGDYEQALELEE
jgi:hypothetical protein